VTVLKAGLTTVLLLTASFASIAQQPGPVFRVGRLSVSTTPAAVDAFRHGLREFGWIPGSNVAIEFRDAGGHPDRLLSLARDLVAAKPDVIVAAGVDAIIAVRQVTTAIPIVAARDELLEGSIVREVEVAS
jgi:putative tryptophan/tyrosine transport system substrate-binding protein